MKIEGKYKWLARDKTGYLCAYVKKPIKDSGIWDSNSQYKLIEESDDIYSFIKWEDETPWSVKEAIFAIEMRAKEIEGIERKGLIKTDIINKPSHYHSNGIDVIGFAEAQFSKEEQKGFHRINAIKYITRYDRKNGVEDLNKAKFYIDKLIEMEESE